MKGRSLILLGLLVGAFLGALSFPAAAATVVFDQGHGERFVIDRSGPLDLSSLAEVIRQRGGDVASSGTPLTDTVLASADALVISGPFAEPMPAELDAVDHFLERGGRLAVMLHIGTPVAGLLHRLGVDFSNAVIHEQHDIIGSDPGNFRATRLASHPLFAGVKQFSLYGVWAVMAFDDQARVIASTSPDAWIDLDGDGVLSPGDAVQSFGVAVAGRRGKGEFVVFGDDAIFQNKFLDDDNRALATNLASWLTAGDPRKAPRAP